MYNGMMDPELMKLAQEQMSRIPPEELARIQQQMMANPELLRLATESMKNLRPEDMKRAAEQLQHVRTEDMVEVSEKMAKASPEEIASIKARADAQVTYELNAAQMLKQQGNELHSRGQFHDAAKKYLLAKNNLNGIPSSKGGILQMQCSLNLMSCYLKMKQFEDCIREGSEVLAYDSKNVKAFYRRGQAYKEIGNLQAAVSDFNKAHEMSPDDETIADVLSDANEKLIKEGGNKSVRQGLVIEEIVEDEKQNIPSENHRISPAEHCTSPSVEIGESSLNLHQPDPDAAVEKGCLEGFRDNPENIRLFQNYISNADPSNLEALGMQGMSPGMIKTATNMIGKMKPEELQKMFQVASSLNERGPDVSRLGSKFPEMTPEMIKMASDTVSKMSPEDLQNMLKVTSSLNVNSTPPTAATDVCGRRPESGFQSSEAAGTSSFKYSGLEESNSGASFLDSRVGQSSSSIPPSPAALQESMQNSMKDPSMRQQMFASMMKNMSPEMMANMSEQFGMKLSKEDAAKAQQAMSQLSPEDLDRMLRWADRAQQGVQTAKNMKNWLLGRPGMILAVVMLILAFIFHQLGFIGG
ncbi:outer envelope protein 61-like isoform X1 [Musa acuminata AAA Group]|uniref:outer envelope protein 61 isoform X1 n=1 Tax=Musa acuminata AAA Group TaxID=214697 RepID=UPI0031DB8600